MKLPARWRDVFGDADTATLTRPFNRPTSLDTPGVSVFLRVESSQSVGQVLLNGAGFDGDACVLDLLQPSNQLAVELTVRDAEAAILEAWLEIHES